jgi:hypothetical protein
MDLLEIEAERSFALHAQGLAQDISRHERVAVAIASDPTADPQERGHLQTCPLWINHLQLVFEVGIEMRELAKKRVIILGETVRHLVEDPQPLPAQNAGLPQGEDRTAQSVAIRR